ncbi:MAG: hypothetical protein C0513_03400, partial [Isosphaera sp.]|nr:hypothetical protein [Isosphaera sp.]
GAGVRWAGSLMPNRSDGRAQGALTTPSGSTAGAGGAGGSAGASGATQAPPTNTLRVRSAR